MICTRTVLQIYKYRLFHSISIVRVEKKLETRSKDEERQSVSKNAIGQQQNMKKKTAGWLRTRHLYVVLL